MKRTCFSRKETLQIRNRTPSFQVRTPSPHTPKLTTRLVFLIYSIVFLRVLEYYDGILILTTNRVGTFDEAFKSRIHLALRYSNLDEDQRVEIWHNFIRMLAKTKERVDIDDLELNVHKLAQVELNGRQIRNVITLARYLAKFRKQMLVYKHVQDAFASVVKFDEYLLKLRGSDDRWATESRLR